MDFVNLVIVRINSEVKTKNLTKNTSLKSQHFIIFPFLVKPKNTTS
jgi:hypothetical protein